MRVIIAAGGTAGHINPAIATATELERRVPDAEILFIGTKNKMEHDLVPKAGFDFYGIDMQGFSRKKSLKAMLGNILVALKAFIAMCKTWSVISKFKPDVVVGFGGYVSGPVVKTAARRHIPTCIHEQNAFPGVTNQLLAKVVDKVMLTDERAIENGKLHCKNEPIVTGLPVRSGIYTTDRSEARQKLSPDGKPIVLSFGGSLGAENINKAMVDVISNLAKTGECEFYHVYGKYGKWVPAALREKGVEPNEQKNVTVREYIYDMEKYLAAADIVVSRSGAATLSEIEALGIASILIPSPNVSENHQYHNACTLGDIGAAEVIEEKDLTSELLTERVHELVTDEGKRTEMGKTARTLAKDNAQTKICEIIESIAKKN